MATISTQKIHNEINNPPNKEIKISKNKRNQKQILFKLYPPGRVLVDGQ
jgi:hypothetical protein